MYACLAVGLLLLAVPAGALVPDTITIDTTASWVTAGSGETAAVTVQVSNSTSGNTSFGGVAVDFAVDSAYGSISPVSALTDSAGTATAVFKPAQRSGDVTITARFSSLGQEVSNATVCRIDHAAPYVIADVLYEPEVTVGETTAIAVRVADRYGNPVDSRREDALNRTPETVYFMVGSPTGNATFVGAAVPDEIAAPVDTAGNATATLRVDTAAGENLVFIQPPVPVRSGYISITGVADGVPSGITQVVDPPGASVPADGDKVVEFTYTLLDGYGNLAAGQGLWVNASIQREGRPAEQENALLYSNSRGQVMVAYGPEDSVGIVTITATAAANPNVSVSQAVEFTSTDPVNMLLSANPQSMPSRDVKSDTVSQIRAKVMDVKGNPVDGETVMFEIVNGSVDVGAYNQTEAPSLDAASAVTNANGYAIVGFHPGAFTTDPDAPDYSPTATGTATVRATWNGTTRTIPLTWKNYPYLSVETAVSPETVAVNETVNVTIRLKGDGWALQPDPIDVVLCTDRSGSMLKDYPDRMVKAMEASELFNVQMNYPRDRLGLVSFGKTGYTDLIGYGYRYWLGQDNTYDDDYGYRSDHYPADPKYYANYATLDLPMSDDPSVINATIEQTVPDWGTPMRSGIYKAINELSVNGRADAVKAVIVLSDGDYNHYGDPLARGDAKAVDPSQFGDLTTNYFAFDGLGEGRTSNQNMSVFAMSNDIRIYSIAFARDITSGGKETLRVLAESTGGKYYYADTGDDLAQVYTDIAGELKIEASVDTELDVVFENVEVNEAPVSGADVFDYVYEYGASTTVESWVDNQTGHYEITPKYTLDQTADWNADQNLHFDIGTVRLGQTWETVFRLKVLTDGNINVFGPGSTITFNNGTDNLTLPDTFITAIPDLNNTGITNRWLEVDLIDHPIPPPGQDAFTDTVPLTWTVTYNGTRDIDEALAYSNDNGRSWTVFWAKTVDRSTTEGEILMDVKNLPAGEYLIRLVASALDAPEAVDTTDASISIGNASGTYIKIG
ncbi:MAG: hypothetical protein PWR21_1351 [Methanoculleus sp.]|nr:hypothetical protein [Methanoculleus sp.]